MQQMSRFLPTEWSQFLFSSNRTHTTLLLRLRSRFFSNNFIGKALQVSLLVFAALNNVILVRLEVDRIGELMLLLFTFGSGYNQVCIFPNGRD